MDTASFLSHILPHEGLKILAEPVEFADKATGKTRTGWRYTKYEHVSVMAEAAAQLDAAGRTVYFAVNGFGDWYEDTDKNTGKVKRRIRTQKNVVACRALYDDIDIGKDGCYATRKEAGEAIKAFARGTGITPTIVNSGGGIHLYWPLTEDVTPEEWLRLAHLKRAVTQHFGLKVDRAVDLDSARVLRPVGSHNRKRDEAREVKLMHAAGPYTVHQVERALVAYVKQHNLTALPPAPSAADMGGLGDLSAGVEYPPSSAHEIIKHCPTMARVAVARGDVPEPLWRGMIGVVKHTVEGEPLVHEWSAGHPDYDPGETQDKLDNWATGPTLCATFARDSDLCAGCEHNGKTKSPITLGYTGEGKAPEVETVNAETGEVEIFTPPHWPQGYHWDGRRIAKAVFTDDGVEYVPFTNILFYPVMRVRTADGTWAVQFRAHPGTRNDRTFLIPTKSLAEPQGFGTALGAYEVFTVGKNGRQHAMDFAQTYLRGLMDMGVETVTYPNFGWIDDGKAFVLGAKKITAKGEEDILPGPTIGPELAAIHSCGGDLNSWVELVDLIYNRPGAEPYQFIFCAALAAPLVELTAAQAWHGIPIALTGPSGLGKTSTLAVACSMYGHHDRFILNGGTDGTTLNAAIKRFGDMRNLPVILDEITGRPDDEMRNLLYSLSNGRTKERMTSSGEPHSQNGLRWNMLSFISGNDEMSEMLGKLSSNVATATELRVLDVKIPADFNAKIWPGVNVKEIIEQKLSRQYGHAGRKWLRFLIKNREAVHALLDKEMGKWSPRTQAETQERFYMNTLIHAVVAGRLAQKLGLLRFDVDAVWAWGLGHIESLRSGRASSVRTPEDYLAQFLSTLHGKTIVTKHYRDSRSETPETPLDPLPRGASVARQALVDRKLFVAVSAFNDWCRDSGVSANWLRGELDREGYFVHRAGEGLSRRGYLGTGTNMATGRARVYEFDYAKAIGAHTDAGAIGKVVHLKPKEAPDEAAEAEEGVE